MKRSFTAVAVAALGLAGLASADVQTGKLQAASADATVFAVRGGETLSLVAGDKLYAGDRIMTSGVGSVTLSFDGCSVDVPASNMVVLGEGFCDSAVEGPAFGGQAGFDNVGPLGLGIGALIVAGAVTGIVIAATDDDEDDDIPTSP